MKLIVVALLGLLWNSCAVAVLLILEFKTAAVIYALMYLVAVGPWYMTARRYYRQDLDLTAL